MASLADSYPWEMGNDVDVNLLQLAFELVDVEEFVGGENAKQSSEVVVYTKQDIRLSLGHALCLEHLFQSECNFCF